MRYICFMLLTISFIGCCPEYTKEPIVRIDTIKVYIPGDNDTLLLIQNDTIWQASNDRYFVRVDTLIKRVYVSRKADTVRVPYPDTVTVFKEVIKEKGFFDGITLKEIMYVLVALTTLVLFTKFIAGK